jgi:Type II secretory pathway, pullulanase PulA and related glycosidases
VVFGLYVAGIWVIFDVVYNYTSSSGESSFFDQMVSYFYFRTTPNDHYTNDTNCDNNMTDERNMVHKYILNNLKH